MKKLQMVGAEEVLSSNVLNPKRLFLGLFCQLLEMDYGVDQNPGSGFNCLDSPSPGCTRGYPLSNPPGLCMI